MDIITKEFRSKNGIIKISCIQTGKLAVKESVYNTQKQGFLSTLKSFWDKNYCEWLPVYTFLIEHPEGVFLIDTGITSDVKKKAHFKNIDVVSRYYFTNQMLFDVRVEEEIHNQLHTIGLKTEVIDKVILTHLHVDHTSGLKYFPSNEILVNQKEWDTMDSSFPKLFPKNQIFSKVKMADSFENFNNAHFVTDAKDLIMIETPGHTRGHCSIILKINENQFIVFGGDVAYNEYRLFNKQFSSTIKSQKENRNSCDAIIEFARNNNTIFLSSHDSENAKRLVENIQLKVP
ncbi:MBL fold metallo-hydrolase [Tenacibaculum sp. MEBiC06402]|uniref:MBL fold metallo-hydrolase n=1 Tax=unclassified Tenacibaculum TaxID=2635139 RepID=UPI003B9C14CB